MSIVTVQNLTKRYPTFCLEDISFSLDEGHITGFIGRNGAGKTTTIKCMLNLVHPDSGSVLFFNKPISDNEQEIKKAIGFSTGTTNWYPRKPVKEIVSVMKSFYDTWDDVTYEKYKALFELDDNKTPSQMSEGMKVKCNLLLALSHNARILILDEPTSGLDPFSRDELLHLFQLIKAQGVAIFFSTHIVSDLEKSADDILYISKGKIVDKLSKKSFIERYSQAEETLEQTILRIERGDNNV